MIRNYYFKEEMIKLKDKLIKQVAEELLEIIDKYELSIAEYKTIVKNTIEVMENIAIIPKNRRYSQIDRSL
jgi:hypothetical protein